MKDPAIHSVVLLGLDRPLAVAAAEHLLAECPPDADLSERIVVTSGRRTARILLGELAASAAQRGLPLAPPRVVTPSEIPDLLAPRRGLPASDLARRFAWERALEGIDPGTLARVMPNARLETPAERSRCAATLRRACDELARAGLRPRDVAQRAESDARLGDVDRWHAIHEILDAARDELASLALRDPAQDLIDLDPSTIEPPIALAPIVLVGVPTLAPAIRRILDRVPTLALVLACEDRRDAFDTLGCVRTDAWLDISLDIDPRRVVFAETVQSQASCALALIAREASGRFADEVTLGVVDDDLTPHLERLAQRASSLTIRPAAGTPIERTRPFRLLALAHGLLAEGSFEGLCALLRHPDAERAIRPMLDEPTPGATLDALDRYAHDHLPRTLSEPWRSRDDRLVHRLDRAREAALDLLTPLRERSPRAAHEHADAILGLLERVYADLKLSPGVTSDHLLHESLRAIVRTIEDLRRLPARMDSASALSLLLASLRGTPLPPLPNHNAIEALGWLELLGDVGEVLVVCGFQEGRVPVGVGNDPILTEPVREALGMETDADRVARDAMILETLARTRNLWIVVGSRSASGDPQIPSRLLFRCARWLEIARQWVDLAPSPRLLVRPLIPPAPHSAFGAMPILPTDPPETLRISSLREYLRSPYLFALRHLIGLESRGSPEREVDAGAFGTILHEVLARLSDPAMLDIDDPRVLETFLLDTFSSLWLARVGDAPPVAARIQRHIGERLLVGAAGWQAKRRREGWRIERTEWPARDDPAYPGVALEVDDRPVLLRGRIDRIDRHDKTRDVCLIDYKSGRDSHNPMGAHRARDGTWRDLQLPLYDLLARSITRDSLPEFAYVSLNPERKDVSLALAHWTRDDLDSAIARTRAIVREIRAGGRPPLGKPRAHEDDLALLWIAGVGLIDRTGEAS